MGITRRWRLPDADAIHKFNAEFAFIADPPSYYSFGSETLLRKEAFLDLTANRYRMVEVQTAKGCQRGAR